MSKVNGAALTETGIDLELHLIDGETITAFMSYEDLAANFIESILNQQYSDVCEFEEDAFTDEPQVAQYVKDVCASIHYLADYIQEAYGNSTCNQFLKLSERKVKPFGH